MTSDQNRLLSIFLPGTVERRLEVQQKKGRFVHYTSAEAAMSILKAKSVWMRNSSCMNDYTEVIYGLDQIQRTYRSKSGEAFKAALSRIFPELPEQFEAWFFNENEKVNLIANTYLTCVSEHDERDDEHGRLSMWRAYGDVTPVAIVLNNNAFLNPAEGLGAFARPVTYFDDLAREKEFERVSENIANNASFINSQGPETILRFVREMLLSAAVTTKHPSFEEEKEWRVVHFPTLESSSHVRKEIVVINGIPQPVYKLPLEDIPEVGLFASIPKLVNRIIIGPSSFQLALGYAFQQLLADANVEDPNSILRLSLTPIRRQNI